MKEYKRGRNLKKKKEKKKKATCILSEKITFLIYNFNKHMKFKLGEIATIK